MPKCNFCGADISIEDKKCPFCGEIIELKKPNINRNINPTKPNVDKPENVIKPNIDKPNNSINPTIIKPNTNKLNIENIIVDKFIFNNKEWQSRWENLNGELGIILTDTRRANSINDFENTLQKFINFKKESKIHYELLDLKCEKVIGDIDVNVNNIVNLLKTIYNVKVPNYLLIIGDDLVIPKAIWDNKAGDNDEVVPSDFVYITLDTVSPWNGRQYNLNGITKVGRIPASKTQGFIEAKIYLENIMRFKPYNKMVGFSYSASQWTNRSKEIFAGFSEKLYLSPKYVAVKTNRYPDGFILPKVKGCNALGINLHGSSNTQYWYGQEGNVYPEAFHRSLLPNDENYYIVSVEACYGAKSKISIVNKDSILLNALMNKCVGFVGSSMIAYGAVDGYPLSCGDIINKEFLNNVKKGETLGEAFINSLIKLLKGRINEKVIKTLAEFALYGDPSLIFIENNNNIVKMAYEPEECVMADVIDNCDYNYELIPIIEKVGYLDNGIHEIDNMAYAGEASIEIDNVANMVNQKSDDCVSKRFEGFESVKPKIFKINRKKEYRSIYQKEENDIQNIVAVHLDEFGNVEDIYVSK